MAGFRSGSLGEPVPWVPCSQQVTPAVGRAGPRPAGCWGQAYRGARKPQPGLQGRPPRPEARGFRTPGVCPVHVPRTQPPATAPSL